MAHDRQEVSGRQSAWTAAYDSYAFTCVVHFFRYVHLGAVIYSVSLKSAYVYRRVDEISPASRFTWMFTDKSAYCRERVVFADEVDRIVVTAF